MLAPKEKEMDPTRFDAFTKALAMQGHRRQTVKTVAATVIGALLGLSRVGAVSADDCWNVGHRCSSDNKCCSGHCSDSGYCCYKRKGRPCSSNNDCCSGYCCDNMCSDTSCTSCGGSQSCSSDR